MKGGLLIGDLCVLTIDIGGAKEPGMLIIPIKKGAKEPREPPKLLVSIFPDYLHFFPQASNPEDEGIREGYGGLHSCFCCFFLAAGGGGLLSLRSLRCWQVDVFRVYLNPE